MSASASPSLAELLATPVAVLPGVGPQRAKVFARLKINAFRDAIFFFPREYQDQADERLIDELEEGAAAAVIGTVAEIDSRPTANGTMLGVLIQQDSLALRALWFNQPFMRARFKLGHKVKLFGQPRLRGMRWEMTHPLLTVFEENEGVSSPSRMIAIYPLTEGLKQPEIRRLIDLVIERCADRLEELFPESFRAEHQLAPIAEAIRQIHAPANPDTLATARRRLIFQELFLQQLALARRRRLQADSQSAPALEITAKIDARIRRILPFEFTPGQRAAVAEIAKDLALTRPMNRLLQGDVGSGKTMVAVYAMLGAVAHGHQAALMAPTEILAMQHYQTLGKLLGQSRVRLGLLTGSRSAKDRRELLAKILSGEVDLVVGTQAIIQESVVFHKLGLVVIDEQHKFGVRQRAALRQAGLDPHYLVMTATPIPRTITMALHGDLDVTTLKESPPGRLPIRTYLVSPEQEANWWTFVAKKLREGRQAYVVAPLIDSAPDETADQLLPNNEDARPLEVTEPTPRVKKGESAESWFETLSNGPLEAFRIDLLHGRLSSDEKSEAIERFRAGKTQVLVSTQLVEVGVDVPNATVMTILGAERFGLAQMHQLRGRVGRGAASGSCGVFADPQSDDARQRLEAFVASTDGFHLAELDFVMRGPGNVLGERQHGMPPLRIADLARDQAILAEAGAAAKNLIDADPALDLPEHALLKKRLLARHGEAIDISDVG